MNKSLESFLDKVVWPLLVLALTPIFTLIGSKLQSGDWLTWFVAIPIRVRIAFVVFVVLWLVAVVITRRIRRMKERNLPSASSAMIPPWGYTTVGTLPYKKVVWRIQVPEHSPEWIPSWEEFTVHEKQPTRVTIDTPPRCPRCNTELEETETFFRRYRWTCLRCGFKTKNEMSYYNEAVRAEKIAQSWWEQELKNSAR